MLESKIESQVVKWAQDNGIMSLKLNVLGRRGWPDRMFIKSGKVLFIEFKAPGKKPEPIQVYIMELLRKQSMLVAVHDNVEDAIGTMARVFD